MKRTAIVLALVGIVFLAGGCTRGIKEVFGVVKGGKGVCSQVQAPAQPLGMYRNIEVGRFTVSFGAPMPGSLLAKLPGQITAKLRDRGLPLGGAGKTLLIQGDVIYYETAAVSGQLFGPMEEAIANVVLVDKASSKVIAKATCVGRSNSTTSQGVDTKAEGLAEAIADWIAKHSPKAAK